MYLINIFKLKKMGKKVQAPLTAVIFFLVVSVLLNFQRFVYGLLGAGD